MVYTNTLFPFEYLGLNEVLSGLVSLSEKAFLHLRISQFISPDECRAPGCHRRHGGAPADEDPAHHEEHLSPAVYEHLLVGVGRARILHGEVAPLARPEHCLLPEDDEDGPGEGEA